ncbi:MAG: polysaccharide biosynthesis tyrosine autokinase [Verrucomicrobia bacterium]|nr:polysaccharide biosynthesis tyrosine autokinase [Verrucomicrobiota bacterium]
MNTTDNNTDSLHFLDYWRVIRARKEIVIAVFLLVVLTGILFTLAMPKVYSSSAIIQVTKQQTDIPVFERETFSYDPLFLRTQFEIIQSTPVLEEVVRRRQLDRKLAEAYGFTALGSQKAFERVVKILSRSLRVQHYRDTNLIEIQINFSEPKDEARIEAAATADMVARVFREISMSRTRRTKEVAIEALKQSLADQQDKVLELRDKVEHIRQTNNIAIFDQFLGSSATLEKSGLLQLESQRIRTRAEVARKKSLLNKVKSLSDQDLLATAPYLVGDVALAKLVQEKDEADIKLVQLQVADLGEKHPEVMAVKAAVAEISSKLKEKLNGLKIGIENEYDASQAEFDELERMLAMLRGVEIRAESGGYLEFNNAREELEHAKRIHDALEMRYRQEQIELDIPATSVQEIAAAKVSNEEDYVSPRIILNIALSLVLGLFLGVGLAYFVEYIDTSVKTIDDVEKFMQIPVIGVIPQRVEAFTDRASYRDHAESYRMLRTNVRFSDRVENGKSFCITSGSMAEGKSLTVFNLAYTCAQLGDRVLVVDADLHRPRQHKIVNKPNIPGLANILIGDATVAECLIETGCENLTLLPSGKISSGPHGLLDTARMRLLVKELELDFDLILYDAPPIIGVSDASLLVREMDGVMMVIQHRKYPRTVSMRAKMMIENTGAPLMGVVLNKINLSRDYSEYYHYSYYYYQPRGHERENRNNAGRTSQDRLPQARKPEPRPDTTA